jgi:uncharacterized protein (TIGR02284 family)
MIIHDQTMELLAELVRTNRDVEAAFIVCAAKVHDEAMSSILLAQAVVSARVSRELGHLVNGRDGGFNRGAGSKENAPNWVALHDELLADNLGGVLDECLRAEDRLLVRFRDVLEHPLSVDIFRVVKTHFAASIHNCGRLRHLRLQTLQSESARSHRYAPSVKATHSM